MLKARRGLCQVESTSDHVHSTVHDALLLWAGRIHDCPCCRMVLLLLATTTTTAITLSVPGARGCWAGAEFLNGEVLGNEEPDHLGNSRILGRRSPVGCERVVYPRLAPIPVDHNKGPVRVNLDG